MTRYRNTYPIATYQLEYKGRTEDYEIREGYYSHGNASNYERVKTWFILTSDGRLVQKSYGQGIKKILKYLNKECPERKKHGITLQNLVFLNKTLQNI